MLSKSKATFVFSAVTSLVLLIMQLKDRGLPLKKILLISFLVIAVLAFLLFIFANYFQLLSLIIIIILLLLDLLERGKKYEKLRRKNR